MSAQNTNARTRKTGTITIIGPWAGVIPKSGVDAAADALAEVRGGVPLQRDAKALGVEAVAAGEEQRIGTAGLAAGGAAQRAPTEETIAIGLGVDTRPQQACPHPSEPGIAVGVVDDRAHDTGAARAEARAVDRLVPPGVLGPLPRGGVLDPGGARARPPVRRFVQAAQAVAAQR
eukprot:CAMPEP_0118863508 /NCGR_PEP_ID=MMETSP1163-20130328/8354_1 /TAXON_ID=124430 /ORGANISM="Phaeomonas parva, Strain CCMP2877" /LENGTH=174 /DNA_ID=CAMNT_0006797521 /DNA_START=34 /DNA_END=555 /DNA_ORIENTATION=+